MDAWMFVFHAKTTERILMKLYSNLAYFFFILCSMYRPVFDHNLTVVSDDVADGGKHTQPRRELALKCCCRNTPEGA